LKCSKHEGTVKRNSDIKCILGHTTADGTVLLEALIMQHEVTSAVKCLTTHAVRALFCAWSSVTPTSMAPISMAPISPMIKFLFCYQKLRLDYTVCPDVSKNYTLNFFYHDQLHPSRLKTVNTFYRSQKFNSIFAWESLILFSYHNCQCWRIKIKWSETVKGSGSIPVSQSKLLDSVENFSIINYGMPHAIRHQHFSVKVQNRPQANPYNCLWTVSQWDRILSE
jgi:hypothetical protein